MLDYNDVVYNAVLFFIFSMYSTSSINSNSYANNFTQINTIYNRMKILRRYHLINFEICTYL